MTVAPERRACFSTSFMRAANSSSRRTALRQWCLSQTSQTMTAVSAAAGHNSWLLFLGLYLLGLGWSGGMIGGTALMNESVPASDRVIVQGSADLFMSVCGGLAGFGSGFVKDAFGYHRLSLFGMALAFLVALAALSQLRNRSTGSVRAA